MTKTVFFLPSFAGGGAERVMIQIANRAQSLGRNVRLVVASATGPLANEIDVPVVDLGAASMRRSILAFARFLRTERVGSLVSTLPHANIASVLAAHMSGAKPRLVLRECNNVDMSTGWLTRKIKYRLYNRADAIIAISNGVANGLDREGVSSDKIHVVHNPLCPSLSSADPLHPWFIEGERPLIVAAGRLEIQKGFSSLITAFNLVRQRADCRLVIFGEGSQRHALEQQIRDLQLQQSVVLPGFVSNLSAHLNRSSLFVFSSLWEGFGNVLVEALACGIPIVSTNCESGPAEILNHGEYGLLVPVGDPSALAHGMLRLLEGSPFSKRALLDRSATFSLGSTTERYLKLIDGPQVR